ncbi:putative glutaredoxin [Neocallimastix lanati (nom. inval.)]|uniref:Putative glutaredoxin n=1 Tax=Neocallimastix californiae TaxID=1754190 RepID=A0A1Y2FML6_9FUNG|nr:putative glutaredoxin [Neocallimastix sp. JGI-2020a]ORY85231.1 putative glutaredoxin [Neocallimastix californiae]|eukprot:ORY85231.1 putative glutaredoxin [Neocallimastix californiae]
MSVKKYINNLIKNEKVIIFSKTYCPYCDSTKELFNSLNCPYKVIEVDEMQNCREIEDYLAELTKQRTFPNTFINGQHIGGNDKLQAKHKKGQLMPLIKDFCNN